jgi:phage terminase small subunit
VATEAKAPAGLKTKGKALWRETLAKYDLLTHELTILELACHEVDMAERIRAEINKLPNLTVETRFGSDAPHPLLAEMRQHSATAAALIVKLKLPDADDEVKNQDTVSENARKAAMARHHGPRAA